MEFFYREIPELRRAAPPLPFPLAARELERFLDELVAAVDEFPSAGASPFVGNFPRALFGTIMAIKRLTETAIAACDSSPSNIKEYACSSVTLAPA